MDVQNLMSKLGNDKVGQILGFLAAEGVEGNARGWGMFGNIQAEISALMVQPHFPNLEHVFADVMHPNVKGTIVRPAIMAAVIGYLLDEVDIHPAANKIGKLMKNIAPNVIIGVVYQSLLEHSTLSFSETRVPSGAGFMGSAKGFAKDSEWRFSN